MYGHNPFSIRAPELSNPPSINQQFDFSDLRRLSEFVGQNLGRPSNPQPKLFLSEWTIPTAQDLEFNYHVEQRVQALWITDGLRIARELPSVFAVGWIHLYDELPQEAGPVGVHPALDPPQGLGQQRLQLTRLPAQGRRRPGGETGDHAEEGGHDQDRADPPGDAETF